MNVVHALWMSKLRYGLQLCSKVQLDNTDSKTALMKTLQLTQNRLLRAKLMRILRKYTIISRFRFLKVGSRISQLRVNILPGMQKFKVIS